MDDPNVVLLKPGEELKDDPEENEEEVEGEEEEPELPREEEPTPPGEETVTLTKAELDKLKEERDNYKKGMFAAKGKDKPKAESPHSPDTGEFVTKADFYKQNEQDAIASATTPKQGEPAELGAIKTEIRKNWKDVVAYLPKGYDKSTPRSIEDAIYDAHALWKRRTGTSSDDSKIAVAAISSIAGTGGKTPASTQQKGGILPPESNGMGGWYI